MLISSAIIVIKHNCLLHISIIMQVDMSWILYKLFKHYVIWTFPTTFHIPLQGTKASFDSLQMDFTLLETEDDVSTSTF